MRPFDSCSESPQSFPPLTSARQIHTGSIHTESLVWHIVGAEEKKMLLMTKDFFSFFFFWGEDHTNLSVHENVYDGVVDSAALGQKNWYSCNKGVDVQT